MYFLILFYRISVYCLYEQKITITFAARYKK